MSKSRGTFITAQAFREHIEPEYLRYYLAARINDRIEDIDLNFDDFLARVNSDLLGKYVNIASRTAGFISTHFAGRLAEELTADDHTLLRALQQAAPAIERCYEERRFSEALRLTMELADQANAYINEQQPWARIKDSAAQTRVQQSCTTAINAFRLLTLYLKPVLPRLATAVEDFLKISTLQWRDADELLLGTIIKPYSHLAKRVEKGQIEALLAVGQGAAAPATADGKDRYRRRL